MLIVHIGNAYQSFGCMENNKAGDPMDEENNIKLLVQLALLDIETTSLSSNEKRIRISKMWEKLATEGLAPSTHDLLFCERFIEGIASLDDLASYISKRRAGKA
jgi:hypothetical protein